MAHYVITRIFVAIVLVTCGEGLAAVRQCPNCGLVTVPYPLSTGPNCGDPAYGVRCTAGKLYLDALHGSSYMVTSIKPLNQRLVVRPAGLVGPKMCVSADISKQGVELDPHRPFSITSSNTILLLNCTNAMLQVPVDCGSSNLCHSYIKVNAPACTKAPVCCTFKPDVSQKAYNIKINGGGCLAYQSFVGLDPNIGVGPKKKWPEPGLEIQWELPKEPKCKTQVDCNVLLPKSKCLPDRASAGQKKCLCAKGLEWDPINGICGKCKPGKGKHCIKKKKTALFAGAGVAAFGVLLAAGVTVLVIHRQSDGRTKKEKHKNIVKEREEMLNAKHTGKSSRIFTGREIIKATNNFSKENLIGTGGFGEVFKAVLEDGTITAIKRAKLNNTKGTDQILNEVRILCQVNHRSLVRLLGCCVELELPLLIYEFVRNGTLFDHLHTNKSKGNGKWPVLPWLNRLQIARQTAEGLAYLHLAAVPPIYHRDVKSSNILLDDKLNAKVSDFGLSRLVDLTETNNESHIFTSAQGTLGYLDPEYYRNFQLTDKSDVYSFGVVLLEILTSKKAIDFNRQEEDVNLVVYMKKMMEEERFMECIDPTMKKSATKVEMETMQAVGTLAASCLAEKRQNRPSMKEVADEIEYIISILTRQVVSEA